jgi:cytochrome c biogenesis factor
MMTCIVFPSKQRKIFNSRAYVCLLISEYLHPGQWRIGQLLEWTKFDECLRSCHLLISNILSLLTALRGYLTGLLIPVGQQCIYFSALKFCVHNDDICAC